MKGNFGYQGGPPGGCVNGKGVGKNVARPTAGGYHPPVAPGRPLPMVRPKGAERPYGAGKGPHPPSRPPAQPRPGMMIQPGMVGAWPAGGLRPSASAAPQVCPSDDDIASAIDELTWALSDMNTPGGQIRKQLEYILGMREQKKNEAQAWQAQTGLPRKGGGKQFSHGAGVAEYAVSLMTPKKRPAPAPGGQSGHGGHGGAPGTELINRNWTDMARCNWKGLLLEAARHEVKKTPAASDFEFDTHHDEEVKAGPRFFTTIVCNILTECRAGGVPSYTAEELSHTKKEAEQAAAQLALFHEYPDIYEAAMQAHEAWLQEHGTDESAVKKQRTEYGGPSSATDPKSMLNHGCQLLKGSPLEKGDIVYESGQVEGGEGFVARVTIHAGPEERVFEGEPGDDKRQAEINAAAVAVEEIREEVAEASERREVVLAAKKADQLARKGEKGEKGAGKGVS